ncbi:MAG: hypothetical protein KIT48_03830 [Pseudolabrys sp.]|nr:hypothetical protein [Pseudolabrys sp.]
MAELKVEYEQSNFYRVVAADGAYGGVTPRGRLQFSFYNERGAGPLSSVLTVGPDGSAKESPEPVGQVIVRELEVNVTMDLSSAINFSTWLAGKIAELRSVLKVTDAEWAKYVQEINESLKR